MPDQRRRLHLDQDVWFSSRFDQQGASGILIV